MKSNILKVALFAVTVIGTPFLAANAEAMASCGACVYPAPPNHSGGVVAPTTSCFACHTQTASTTPVTPQVVTPPVVTPPVVTPPVVKPPVNTSHARPVISASAAAKLVAVAAAHPALFRAGAAAVAAHPAAQAKMDALMIANPAANALMKSVQAAAGVPPAK